MKPTTKEDVFDFLLSYTTSAALGAAMELGLFWLLAERPRDAASVAQATGVPINRCRYWLQLLGSVGLVEKVPAGYAPSPTARTAILEAYSQEAWAFLAREARERFPAVRDLALHIREPGSAWDAQGLTPPDYFDNMIASPERARQFTCMLYEYHQSLADELSRTLDMTGVRRLMDLGGGSGVMSLALLRRNPHLTSIVVDIENVCVAGREIATEQGFSAERITYHSADFLREELPGKCDMVLDCDAGAYSEEMLRKIWAALNPGGRLVIVDQFAPAKDVAHASRLLWAFLGSLENPDATPTTAHEVQTRLTQTGFQLVSETTLCDGWVVIEARK